MTLISANNMEMTPLRVLMVEDSENDALLVGMELERAGYDVVSERVETKEGMRQALIQQSWDVIVSDYSMPRFRGTDALQLVKELGLDVPFIFVSGTIQEETAVEAMRAGAHDYLMKGNLKRLAPAVRRELAEADTRRKRHQAEKALRLKDARLRALHEINVAITSTLDLSSLLSLLLEKIDLLLPYSASAIRLYNKEKRVLEPTACRNIDEKEWKLKARTAVGDPANIVFESKAPLFIQNVQADPQVTDAEFYREEGLVSYMGIPLIAKNETLGTLSFFTRDEHPFSEDEIQLLDTLAGQVAVAIQNSQLYEEIKSQATKLVKANEVKSDFLNIVSHELKTPLNVMMGYVGLVQQGTLGEIKPEQNEALQKSLDHSQNLLAMITDILEATRIYARDVGLEHTTVTLNRILNDLKSEYEMSQPNGVRLSWDVSPDLPQVEMDVSKFKRILKSLIDNGLKFTEAGTVQVRVRNLPSEKSVKVEVTDTGRGIPEDQIPVIFDLFRQLDSSTTREREGLGLGLYLAKKNVELMGGQIRVESEVGRGSTFTVVLSVSSDEDSRKYVYS